MFPLVVQNCEFQGETSHASSPHQCHGRCGGFGNGSFARVPRISTNQRRFFTSTPIKDVVVIFQENVSFDYYFGTYPHAFNLPGGTSFHAKDDTPESNTLLSSGLLTNNPNKLNPFRIPPSLPVTCDEDHNYNDEQAAANGGLMDKFVEKLSCNDKVLGPASAMGYYDGNTATAMWNYAQFFAMSEYSWGTTFGPSTPGALNLVARNTLPGTLFPTRPNGKPPSASVQPCQCGNDRRGDRRSATVAR